MKRIKLGIIGVGNMGSGHARNVLEGKCPELVLISSVESTDSICKHGELKILITCDLCRQSKY